MQTIENIDAPITLNSTDTVYLVFYGSGIGSAANVTATLGATTTTVAYAGPQGTYSGLDQYNILVPNSLAGQGPTPLAVTVANRQSNTLTVTFQ